jgi:hypothetical protein
LVVSLINVFDPLLATLMIEEGDLHVLLDWINWPNGWLHTRTSMLPFARIYPQVVAVEISAA